MYTFIFICVFAGFFQLYNTSAKAKPSGPGAYERWLRSNIKAAKITGGLLLLLSYVLLVVKDGAAVGSFAFVLLLMGAACVIIALAPLHYFKLRHMLMIIALSLFMELIIFS